MDKQIVILNMKSRFLLSVVFFGMIAGLSASPVYRMGSYNIRGENAADTGDKDWNVRKEYVVRNIVEHDFDVVGLQENSIKMLPQLEELLGDDYATHSWGAISETSGTHTTIVYKAGKFTLLDKGQIFLDIEPCGSGFVMGYGGTPKYRVGEITGQDDRRCIFLFLHAPRP